jgi:hypothetical protein
LLPELAEGRLPSTSSGTDRPSYPGKQKALREQGLLREEEKKEDSFYKLSSKQMFNSMMSTL